MRTDVMLRAPMARWEALYNRLSADERRQVDDEAAAMATQYARLSAYLSRRMLVDVDSGHADAVKHQNRVAARVRKALGFTYGRDIAF